MAGLSIKRRRKAWLRGVAYGASGWGKCLLQVEKLKEIFRKGMEHGRANTDTPYVRAVVEQVKRRRGSQERPTRRVGRGFENRSHDPRNRGWRQQPPPRFR